MQTSALTATELACLETLLAEHSNERGPVILGAQLGLLITKAIRPKTLRELGGLRVMASEHLSGLVQPVPAKPNSSDIAYQVKLDNAIGARRVDNDLVSGPQEVAGRDLWRYFSNPNLACALSASKQGIVFVRSVDHPLPAETKPLAKPDNEAYRALAATFAKEQPKAISDSLLECLEAPIFYDKWIALLRQLRTPNLNLLKLWETQRSEDILVKLSEALCHAEIDDVKIKEILKMTRPTYPRSAKLLKASAAEPATHFGESVPRADAELSQISTESLRQLVHKAVDLMTMTELREVRVSVGLLLDASRDAINK